MSPSSRALSPAGARRQSSSDPAAADSRLAQLYRMHLAECLRIAEGLLRDPDRAWDAAHEVFASLLVGAPASLKRPLDKGFFRIAARNQALKFIERDRAKRLASGALLRDPSTSSWKHHDVHDVLERRTRRQRARRFVSSLSDLRAQVAHLCLGEGLTSKEAAEVLGVSAKAVMKQRLKLSGDLARFRGGGVKFAASAVLCLPGRGAPGSIEDGRR